MEFKEFLKKHQAEADWNKYYIPTKKLGEWAWNKMLFKFEDLTEDYSAHKKDYGCSCFDFVVNQIECTYWPSEDLWNIVLACIGKEEVEKRFAKMQERMKEQ